MIILKNGRIIDPANKIDAKGNVWIKYGKIEKIVITGPKGSSPKDEDRYKNIDVKGAIIAPGLVDMHVHFRDPGLEYKEDIKSGVAAASAGGFTSVACMANTKPVNDSASITKYIVDKSKALESTNVFPIASVTKEMKGEELSEFGDLKESGAVALSDDGLPVMNSRVLRRALEYAKDFDMPIIEHCEDANLKGKGVMNEGEVSTRIGLEGIPCEAESSMVQRNIDLVRLTGGKMHLAHISCEKSVRAIKTVRKEKLPLTCEATPHHFTLTDEAVIGYDTNTKVNPPLRTAKDVEVIKSAIADGTIDAIASDHAPHAEYEKGVEYDLAPFGLVGLETMLSLSLALVEQKVIDLKRLIELLSLNPAKILNIDRGTLSKGAVADIVVFDPKTIRTIDTKTFRSKSKNTPFAGRKVKGKVLLTVVSGKIVFDKFSKGIK